MHTSIISQLKQASKIVTAPMQLQNFPPLGTETRPAAKADWAPYEMPTSSMQELMAAVKERSTSSQELEPFLSTKGQCSSEAKDGEHSAAAKQPPNYLSLANETRSHVETGCAAFHLNRTGQTLRSWSCLENGPMRPTRINGRLAWSVVDIKKLLNGGE